MFTSLFGWSLFDRSRVELDHQSEPAESFVLDASPYELIGDMTESAAWLAAREIGYSVVALPTRYKTHHFNYQRAKSIARGHLDLRSSSDQLLVNFWAVGVNGFSFSVDNPAWTGYSATGQRIRGAPEEIIVDAVDGHVWGEGDLKYFGVASRFRYAPPLSEWQRDLKLQQLPSVLRTRILALGEPFRSNWFRDMDSGQHLEFVQGLDASRVSRELAEIRLPLFAGRIPGPETIPGPEILCGVFRRERWFGRTAISVTVSSLIVEGLGLFEEAFGGLNEQEFTARFRESFVGAPTIKFEGQIFCGVSNNGLVCVIDDHRNVVVEAFWAQKVDDRYSLFELPDWLASLDLSTYK
jgi:hypothetical protein